MVSRTIVFITVQAILLQVAFGQVINRIPLEALLSSPFIAPNLLQIAPNLIPVAPEVPVVETVVPAPVVSTPVVSAPVVSTPIVPAPIAPVATTTIIQDSTVANSLANALQLLIVSNLLSNTLPTMGDVLVPACAPSIEVVSPVVSGLGPVSYVY